jgi:hypothetical protein|tara:strand:- start:1087 stop:1647 length:561 start_codon:yes stop_codon:yes gene_type:complete
MSTLHVENLKGLSSGGNANKVIIPTGQTLEVADNIRYDDMPAGSIVQVADGSTSTYTTTSSTSFVATNLACTITPRFANSRIHLRVTGSVWFGTASASGNYAIPTIYRGSTNIGVGGSYNALAFYGAHGTGYETWDRMITFEQIDVPNTTSSTTYTVYMRAYSNSSDARMFEGITKNIITAFEVKV